MMFIYFSVKNRNLFSFFFVLRQFLVIISNRLSINYDILYEAVSCLFQQIFLQADEIRKKHDLISPVFTLTFLSFRPLI